MRGQKLKDEDVVEVLLCLGERVGLRRLPHPSRVVVSQD